MDIKNKLVVHAYVSMIIIIVLQCYKSSFSLFDEVAILVHQDIIYKNMNLKYTVPPKRYTECVSVKEHGYPNLIRQINHSFPRKWNQSIFVEFDEPVKELNVPEIIEKNNNATQNFTINVLADVFVSMLQVVYHSKKYYYSYPGLSAQSTWLDEWTGGYLPTNIVGSYDTVVCLGHYNNKVYGHYMLDFLSPLMLIPEEVRQRCKIPYAWRGTRTKYVIEKSPYAMKGLLLAGLHPDQLVIMFPNDLVFAREAYIYDIHPFNWDCSEAIVRLRESINKNFKVTKKPFRLGLYNRKWYQSRNIKNFDVIFREVQKRWSKAEIIPDFSDFYGSIKYYQGVQSLFMGFHGSILGNVLFMQAGTSVCEFMTRKLFTNSLDITMPLGIHHVMGCFPNYTHHTYTPTMMNVTDVISMIEKCNNLAAYE